MLNVKTPILKTLAKTDLGKYTEVGFCRGCLLVLLQSLAGIRESACRWDRHLHVVDFRNTHGHVVCFGKCFVGYCFDPSLGDDRAVTH